MAVARILVVEDDEAFARYLEAHLEKFGYGLAGRGRNAVEAIQLAETLKPDLVIMDIVMSGEMDGIAAAGIIRQRFDLPVLYLTAYSQEQLFERARITSPYAYITKPFNERELHLTIEIALDQHRLLQELKRSREELASMVHERTASLANSESRYRHLVEGIADAVFLIDPAAMRFVDVNEAACASTGYTREELLQLGPQDLKPFFNRQRLSERFARLQAGDHEARIIETVHKRKDDSVFPVEVVLRAFDIDDRAMIVAVARDITERRRVENRLREAEERFRQFAENIDEVFWIQDVDECRFIYMSPAYEALTGKPVNTVYRNPRSFLSAVHPDDRDRVDALYEAQCRERVGMDDEHRLLMPNGEVRWVWTRSFPVRDLKGRIYRIAGISQDVTQRRLSEDRYRTVMQSSMDGFWELNLAGRLLEVNEAYCRQSGYRRHELLTMAVTDLEASESEEDTARHIERIIAQGYDRFESRHRTKAGDLRDVEVSVYLHGQGEQGRMYAFFRDITDRNRAETALKESEARYRSLITRLPGIAYRCACDTDWTMEIMSEATQGITGYPAGDFLEKRRSYASIIHPGDRDRVAGEVAASVAEHAPFELEYRLLHAEGRVVSVHESGHGVFDDDGQLLWLDGFIWDVTQRNQIEAALRSSEARSRSVLRAAPIGIGLIVDRIFQDVNESMTRMTGYAREELIGQPARLLYPSEEDFDYVGTEKYRQIMEQGVGTVETRWRCKDGSIINVALSSSPIVAGDFSQGITFTAQDITQARQREERLRMSEAHFRQLFENSPIGIALVSTDYRLSQVNRAFCDMLGYTAEELRQRTFVDITHPEDVAKDLEQAQRLFSGEIPRYQMMKRYLHKDGGIIWIQLTGTIIRDARGAPLYGVGLVEDITQKVEAEQQRLSQEARQRDALVREVHHRIKNNLQGVIGLLRQHVAAMPVLAAPMEEAIAQVNTIALVHGLQSRIHGSELRLCDLVAATAEASASLAGNGNQIDLDNLLGCNSPHGDKAHCRIELDSATAVPVALTLNELFQNAFKHGSPDAPVRVRIDGQDTEIRLRIENQTRQWPSDFDFVTGKGLGTGLSLIKVLLPKRGISLDLRHENGTVCAELVLGPPVTIPHPVQESA
jgi:PAS domain S-box-containing protein